MSGSTGSAAIEAPSGAAGESAEASSRGSFVGWYTVVMTAIVGVMSQIDRGILALFVQPIKRDLHLSDVQVSILLGFAFTIFYVVGGPPLSRAADRGVRKLVIGGSLGVWSLATCFCGIAQGFWSLFASRAVIGASESGCGPASIAMIADAVPRAKLPRAYAIYNAGFVGGAALSLVVGGLLIGLLAHVQPIHVPGIGIIRNWQIVFIIIGAPGLLISALVLTTVPEPKRKGNLRPGGYPLREVFAFLVSQRAMHVPLLAGILCMSFLNYVVVAWTPAFYERTYGWGPATSGPLLGTVALIGSAIGLFGGAFLAEQLGKRHADANLRVLFLAQFLSIPLFVAGPLMPSPWLALAVNGVGGAIGAMGASGYNAALQLASPNEMRTQVNALYFVIMNALAGSLGPYMAAWVNDHLMRSEADLRYVLVLFRVVVGPLTAFFLWKALAPYANVYRQKVAEGVA